MTVGYLTKLNGIGIDAHFLLQAVWESTKLCGCLITIAWVREIYEHDRASAPAIFAASLVTSAAAEILFAFLNATSVLALCLATPLFSVIFIFLYRNVSSGALPLWSTGAYSRSLIRDADNPQADRRLERREWVLLILVVLAWGIIRALEHRNADIASQVQSGLIIKQLFDASGTLLAGALILALLPSDTRQSNVTFFKAIALVAFITAAFISLSAQSWAGAALFTTFADAAYRTSLFLIIFIPLAYASALPAAPFYALLFTANQLGVLVGGAFVDSGAAEFAILIACFVLLLVDVALDMGKARRMLQDGAEATARGRIDENTAEDAARSGNKTSPDTDTETQNDRLLFWVYVSNVYHLTEREFEVLDLLLRGYGIKEIAQELVVSYDTAKSHKRNVLQKMGVSSTEELTDKIARVEREDFPGFLRALLAKAEG